MAKRFSSTEIWSEDWFLDIPNSYKLFWFYILSSCNHAGIFRVNVKIFSALVEDAVDPNTAIKYFNFGKNRIRVLNESAWLIEDFFVYQYGDTININNRVHQSILKEYEKHSIKLDEIRGLNRSLLDLKERVKDKDKEKDEVKKDEVDKPARNKKNPAAAMAAEKTLFDAADEQTKARFLAFKEWVGLEAPRVEQMKEPFTFSQWQKATQEFGKFGDTIKSMHNYQPLLQKNVSAYLTLCKWRSNPNQFK